MIVNTTIIFIKKVFLYVVLAYFVLVIFGLTYSDKLIFLPQAISYQYSDDLVTIASKNADDGSEHAIVARLLINPTAKYTVLYSHGNAVDIGGLSNVQQKFFKHGYSVIIYDYSGYGLSKGSPSEQQVYNDVQAVYDYLINIKKLVPEQIISYGHSLGAAIATDLAYTRPVAALVLENPFVTAFRVKTVYKLVPFDKFASIDKIGQVNTPVFITHSRDDNVIPFWHGEALFEKALNPKQYLWLDKAGHTDITHTEIFWPALKTFISTLSPDKQMASQ
ncbi:MAG: alpha/beta hydrolase [Gammaproteobacteria bacterium]|nr:alpha/beta hydrolase [Gammaproteobacteria bacterium]